jgi:monovalent cation:H+ antiporter, CPA1 family
MSCHTRRQIGMFWSFIDETLIAVPFMLIGLQVLLLAFTVSIPVAGGVAALVTLAPVGSRLAIPVVMSGGLVKLHCGVVFRGGGLHGGISVAVVRSLPLGTDREITFAIR